LARPQKSGLEYFPLDVDIDQDDKILLIEAQHGLVGFGVVIKLLMKIYKHNYYYEWTEKEQLLFSKRVNVDINSINVIVNDCIKWGLFNENMFKNIEILTSQGIQKRYMEAVGRRQRVEIDKRYLLLGSETLNVYKNLVIVDNNLPLNVVNVYINPQSKVKESKAKKSILKKSKSKKRYVVVAVNKPKITKKNFGDMVNVFSSNIHLITGIESEKLKEWSNDLEPDAIILAIEEAVKRNARNLGYIEAILRSWVDKGYKTRAEVENSSKEWTDKQKQTNNKYNKPADSFNNYDQRTYDYDELEKKLLGAQAQQTEEQILNSKKRMEELKNSHKKKEL